MKIKNIIIYILIGIIIGLSFFLWRVQSYDRNYDLNADGMVDMSDVSILFYHFTK